MAVNGHPKQLSEELRNERLLDIERRLKPYRFLAFSFLAAALIACAPWIGWWPLAPLAIAGIAFSVADRLMLQSAYPFRWAAVAWGVDGGRHPEKITTG